jgi:hypothetical protein
VPPQRGASAPGRRSGSAGLAVVLALSLAGCGSPRDGVEVDGRTVRLHNQTGEAWTDVEIWVNDHYRGTANSLAPGAELVAPLGNFVAGFGQRFDPLKQRVEKVKVTARRADGADVLIEWDRREMLR